MGHASAAVVRREVAEFARPPVRMSVAEAAAKYVKVIKGTGSSSWDPGLTPYMIEPMNLLNSREYHTLVFVGPKQCGKTQALIDAWIGWMATCNPADMLIVQTSQAMARDFSHRRIDRLFRASPAIGAELANTSQADNTHDKTFRSGSILNISWPSINELSGRPQQYVALTDYDRMPEDIGRQGSVYTVARGRTETFLSRGMTVIDTSPGFEILSAEVDPHAGPHAAPPTSGALAIFNLGDRRRLYWSCPACGDYWMQPPGPEGFTYSAKKDAAGVVEGLDGTVGVSCPSCGVIHGQDRKRELIDSHLWVPEGCRVVGGRVQGEPKRNGIASFWLPGAAAAYSKWSGIVENYLNGLRTLALTGSEDSLKGTTFIDFGAPYLPQRLSGTNVKHNLAKRAEDVQKRAVPDGVRFLLAAVDVQGHKWVVQIVGYGEHMESWVIDRYDVHLSARKVDGIQAQADPAGRIEDWALIRGRVMESSYPLADGSGRRMAIYCTTCDSGGPPGVTDKAYDFWRRCRAKGLQARIRLLKGERPVPSVNRPRVKQVYPDNTRRSDRKARVAGDIPVLLLNTTALKDAIHADLKRDEPGPGYVHFPDWLPSTFYAELQAERRGPKGWDLPSHQTRNEAFDLLAYARGLAIYLGAERIDWGRPPLWAKDWENNSTVTSPDDDEVVQPDSKRKRRRSGFVNTW